MPLPFDRDSADLSDRARDQARWHPGRDTLELATAGDGLENQTTFDVAAGSTVTVNGFRDLLLRAQQYRTGLEIFRLQFRDLFGNFDKILIGRPRPFGIVGGRIQNIFVEKANLAFPRRLLLCEPCIGPI